MNELYINIRNRRIELDMTQDELAVRTGYKNRSAIARIERGDVDIPQSKIDTFAAALRTTSSALLGLDGTVEGQFIDRMKKYAELLSAAGMEKLIERAEELAEVPKYKKEPPHRDGSL